MRGVSGRLTLIHSIGQPHLTTIRSLHCLFPSAYIGSAIAAIDNCPVLIRFFVYKISHSISPARYPPRFPTRPSHSLPDHYPCTYLGRSRGSMSHCTTTLVGSLIGLWSLCRNPTLGLSLQREDHRL